jgi:hypothetical protein
MNSRRTALSLAAVLAATVLTGGAAILGISRGVSQQAAAAPAVVQSVQPPAPQEEGD